MKSSSDIVGGFSSLRYLRKEYAARLSFMCDLPFRLMGGAAGADGVRALAAKASPVPAAAVLKNVRRSRDAAFALESKLCIRTLRSLVRGLFTIHCAAEQVLCKASRN